MRRAVLLVAIALLASAAEAADLSVGWISRLPRIDYVWKSKRPSVVGWPKAGQKVKWVANVRNLGSEALAGVRFRWLVDGVAVAEGQADFSPHSLLTFELPRPWSKVRQELVFEIDSAGALPESEERNNRLLVHTDALAVGFWVEESFWQALQPIVTAAHFGASSFDDWMQRRLRQYNEMAALALYPETPGGVKDRWRIDAIHVVPDGALPVTAVGPEVRDWGATPESYSTLYPDSKDRSIDIEWGFPTSALPFYQEMDSWALLYDAFVHELGHARYLVDVYPWSISLDSDVIGISPLPPTFNGWLHVTDEYGLMNTSWGYLDRYSAVALNRIAGQRATQGHYNEPSNIGVYLNDLPAKSRVRLVTPEGAVFPHRKVRLYRPSGAFDPDWTSGGAYKLQIDGTPDLELQTDGNGAVLLERNPFSKGPVMIAVDRNNALVILEIVDGDTSHWGYLEARELNLAYWRGQKKLATIDLVVDAPFCFGPGIGPNDVTPTHWELITGPQVTFRWTRTVEELWYSVDGGQPVGVAIQNHPITARQLTLPITGAHVAWWLVYRRPEADPRCAPVRSGIFFFDLRNS